MKSMIVFVFAVGLTSTTAQILVSGPALANDIFSRAALATSLATGLVTPTNDGLIATPWRTGLLGLPAFRAGITAGVPLQNPGSAATGLVNPGSLATSLVNSALLAPTLFLPGVVSPGILGQSLTKPGIQREVPAM